MARVCRRGQDLARVALGSRHLQLHSRRWLATTVETTQDAPNPMPAPLEGVRVIDFSTEVAGPCSSMYLADLGYVCYFVRLGTVSADILRHMEGPTS
jgi:hypothetical protein